MKILDVTLRDGGFVNNFSLPQCSVLRIVRMLEFSGVDLIEVGYLTGMPDDRGEFLASGPTFSLPPDFLTEICKAVSTPITAMLHLDAPRPLDFRMLARCGLALVRVPIESCSKAKWQVSCEQLASYGIPYSVNITSASSVPEKQIRAFAHEAQALGASIFFLADTNGAMLPHSVSELFKMLQSECSIELGFHAHDFQRLALANCFAALSSGASYVDGSLAGIGRSLGNAATEVLLQAKYVTMERCTALHRIIPEVLEIFELNREYEAWIRLCAALNLHPREIKEIERGALADGTDRYSYALRATRNPAQLVSSI